MVNCCSGMEIDTDGVFKAVGGAGNIEQANLFSVYINEVSNDLS